MNSKSAFYSVLSRRHTIEQDVIRLLHRPEDMAWLAGIIEGEGSILWAKYGDREWRAKISVIMHDGAVIGKAASLMGLKAFYDRNRKRWHTYAEGFRAVQLARLIEPFMVGIKKILTKEMIEVGHIFRGPQPPWHFVLSFDTELGKNVRLLEFLARAVPSSLAGWKRINESKEKEGVQLVEA